jgi:hypothetical protein
MEVFDLPKHPNNGKASPDITQLVVLEQADHKEGNF